MRRLARTPSLLPLVILLACHGGASPAGETVSKSSNAAAFGDLSAKTTSVPSDGRISSAMATTLEAHLAAREYWASETKEGIQAPNRAHDLRTYFGAGGVRLIDRDDEARTQLVEFALSAMGRGESLAAVPKGEVFDRGAGRVEIVRRDLGLVEWYENKPEGLEQGFTLDRAPMVSSRRDREFVESAVASRVETSADVSASQSAQALLVLELTITGATASLQGDSIALMTRSGRALSYGKLTVVDARGERLASHFETPSQNHIRLVVEDGDATYPIVIDPLIVNLSDALVQSNQVFALLGHQVAIAGDVNGDGYEDVLVSAPLYDAGQTDEGAVFVFHGGPSGIGNGDPTNAELVIQSNQDNVQLGWAASGAGDVNGDGFSDVVVGAHLYDGPDVDEGAAFLFLGSSSGLVGSTPATAHARLEGNQSGAQFGYSVASAGDVNGDGLGDLIVGANLYDAGQFDEGAAFVFLGSVAGIANGGPGTAHAQFESNQAWNVSVGFGPFMGSSVASAGDVNGDGFDDVIVGAQFYDGGTVDEGAAFIFRGTASGMASGNPSTAATRLESNQLPVNGLFVDFGLSVSSAGDVNGDGYDDVVVGAPFYAVNGVVQGGAFVFHGSAAGVADAGASSANESILGESPDSRMGYGVSSGDVNGDGYSDVVVGDHAFESGTAYVYFGTTTGIVFGDGNNLILDVSPQGFAEFSASVASGGDINGDGLDDVVVGARRRDVGESDEGAAYVYHGSEGTGLRRLHAQLPSSIVQVAATGWSIASAGDVNGDGYSDVIVGAPLYDDGETDEGAAFLFHGSASGFVTGGITASPSTILTSNQVAADFGREVASAGDINGDGFADVIVGAPLYQNSGAETDEGAAFLFLGSASGIANGNPASAHARIESNQVGAAMGVSAASAGDVNGDGYGDIVVGASLYDNGTADEGAAFVFLGSPSGIADGNPANASAILESNQLPFGAPPPVFSFFGASAASAGDVNGDGYDDVIIGAPGSTNGEIGEGMAVVFLGSATGISSGDPGTASGRIEGNVAQGALGLSVASAGDVNGDGYADVIVGASGFSSFGSDGPVAYVFLGSASGITNAGSPATADAELAHDQRLTQIYAVSVGSAGDMNHDGNSDVFVAANPTSLGFGAFAGSVYMFVGSPAGLGDGNPFSARFRIFRPYLTVSDPFADLAAAAGDVNGDGFSDFIVGNPPLGSLVYLGNSEGRAVLVRQRRGDGSGLPVQPGGSAYSSSSFVAEITARSASGRERAKVEIQTCPVGSPLGGPSCLSQTSPTWLDLGTSGAVFNETITGLTPNRSYSWRARVLAIPYASTQPGVVPIVSRGPWFRVQARAMPGDIRTVPEPGIGVGLLAGVLLAAAERGSRAGLRRRTVGRRGKPGLGDAQSPYGAERQCAIDEKHC